LVEDLVEDLGRPLLTVAEVARRLNVSNSAMRTLCRRGLLPYTRVLRFIRLRPEDVDRVRGGS
jgi:excisionase family DNA binding protein